MKTIQLELVEFAIVNSCGRRRVVRVDNDAPPWSAQVRNLRISDAVWRKQHATIGASLIVNHGLAFGFPELWDSFWSGSHKTLCKYCKRDNLVELKCKVALDGQLNLHSDTDYAFESGQVKLYFFHGTPVENSKWILTDPKSWSPQEVLAEPNVDLRRTLIQRKGIEQMLDGLYHRVLDTEGNYSLISVVLGQSLNSACNFLKMLNPSVGCWHMEGVPNNLRTVRDALLWRNNGWFVHADVLT